MYIGQYSYVKLIVQVGFKGGPDYYINASRTPDLVNVAEYSNVNIPGKFVFRVDENYISEGGCNAKGMQFTIYYLFYFTMNLFK